MHVAIFYNKFLYKHASGTLWIHFIISIFFNFFILKYLLTHKKLQK